MMALRSLSDSHRPEDRRKVGMIVAIALTVLTILEFIIAVASIPPVLVWLLVAAAAKAWLIVEFFMHVRQVRGGHG